MDKKRSVPALEYKDSLSDGAKILFDYIKKSYPKTNNGNAQFSMGEVQNRFKVKIEFISCFNELIEQNLIKMSGVREAGMNKNVTVFELA